MSQSRQQQLEQWMIRRRNNLEMQTMVYWYESACLTCLAAWATTLSWPQTSSNSGRNVAMLAGRIILPLGFTAGSLWALKKKDYYEETLDKHLAWLGFHGAIGVSMASGVRILFRATDPRRYAM